jgi:hypothetical protein
MPIVDSWRAGIGAALVTLLAGGCGLRTQVAYGSGATDGGTPSTGDES